MANQSNIKNITTLNPQVTQSSVAEHSLNDYIYDKEMQDAISFLDNNGYHEQSKYIQVMRDQYTELLKKYQEMDMQVNDVTTKVQKTVQEIQSNPTDKQQLYIVQDMKQLAERSKSLLVNLKQKLIQFGQSFKNWVVRLAKEAKLFGLSVAYFAQNHDKHIAKLEAIQEETFQAIDETNWNILQLNTIHPQFMGIEYEHKANDIGDPVINSMLEEQSKQVKEFNESLTKAIDKRQEELIDKVQQLSDSHYNTYSKLKDIESKRDKQLDAIQSLKNELTADKPLKQWLNQAVKTATHDAPNVAKQAVEPSR